MNIWETIVQGDKSATLWLNNLSHPSTDGFWWVLSDIGTWVPFYIVIAIMMLWRLGWKKGLAVVLSVALTVLLVDQGSNLVKYGVARFRPCFDTWMVAAGLRLPYGILSTGKYGFFSAHAGNCFGFAVASCLGLRWYRPGRLSSVYGTCVFCWASLVSLSRVMMGAHFLGDVLAGAVVGLGIGFLCAWLAKLILSRNDINKNVTAINKNVSHKENQ